MLDEIADSIPNEIYNELNGGILLLPEAKKHPESRKSDELYVLGEYHHDKNLGRHIVIYYGSFQPVYGNLASEVMYDKLKKTLWHELTHHMESLAGLMDLEVEDERELADYLQATGAKWRSYKKRHFNK